MSETFGRYQLVKKLATGGMGQVYLARQKGPVGFEKLVVVKRILPHLSEEDEFINMFFDEARIAAALNHPNIAQIYDLGEVDGTYYIAMEYVHGESLRSVNTKANADRGGMPLGLKCRVIADAAAGLDFAHRAKSPSGQPLALIHRDVSPQNVLVAFNGGVKLIDFGVAKAAGKISTTMTGAIKGKYAYMSPEQARGEELDSRSDVFGLGTVFYELLTSSRLFKRESENLTLKAVVGTKVPAPSSLVKGIPRALDAIVLKALAKNRNDRFQSAGELQLALEDLLVKQRIPATSAHLAHFMQELYAKELGEEKLEAEGTLGGAGRGTPSLHRSASLKGPGSLSRAPEPSRSRSAASRSLPSSQDRSQSRSATRGASVSSRSASRSRASRQLPDPAELEQRLLALSRNDSVRGLLFNALLAHVLREGGGNAESSVRSAASEERSYQDGTLYPAGDYLRMLWRAAESLAPVSPSATQAFSELGGACFEGLLSSSAGRTLKHAANPNSPQELLPPLIAALDAVAPTGQRRVEELTPQFGVVVLKRDPFPPVFTVGFISRAFETLLDMEARCEVDKRVSETLTFHVRW